MIPPQFSVFLKIKLGKTFFTHFKRASHHIGSSPSEGEKRRMESFLSKFIHPAKIRHCERNFGLIFF